MLERKTGLEPASLLHGKQTIYQLIYFRKIASYQTFPRDLACWRSTPPWFWPSFPLMTGPWFVWSIQSKPSITPPEETDCRCSPKALSRSALAGRDSNPRTRMGADLQSAAFSHFATYQYIKNQSGCFWSDLPVMDSKPYRSHLHAFRCSCRHVLPWYTCSWPWCHHVIPIHWFWAKDGTRTRDLDLGKVTFYQLNYFRIWNRTNEAVSISILRPGWRITCHLTYCCYCIQGAQQLSPAFVLHVIALLSRWRDSNPRQADYKTAALPTELHRHIKKALPSSTNTPVQSGSSSIFQLD